MSVRGGTVALTIALGLSACGPPTDVTLHGDGFSVRVTGRPFGLTVTSTSTGAEVVSTSGGPQFTRDRPTFDDQLLPGWDGYRQHLDEWTVLAQGQLERLDDRAVRFTATGADPGGTLEVRVDGPRLRLRQAATGGEVNYAGLQFRLPGDEHFFGLGERYQTVDHRGQSLYSWAEELGLGGGEASHLAADNPYPNGPSMTGFPVPFFISTRGYAAHLDTTLRSTMHFGSQSPDRWSVEVNGSAFDLVLYVTARPAEALNDYTADTGRPVVPAPWVWGPRRRINRGAMIDGVEEWRAMRQRNLPITGIDDSTHFLPANSHIGKEAALGQWVQTLHDNGFKVMAYNNPYVSQSQPKAAAEYQYGTDHGLFEKAPTGEPAVTFFISGSGQYISAFDLTNPEAVAWFQSLLSRTLDLGYDGWMHDFGEYVARSSTFSDGRRGAEVHNQFPVLSAKAAHDLLEARRPNDSLFFVRSGYAGTQAFAPAVWGGDAEATFDDSQGMPAMLRGGLNLGLSGVPYWGSDVGGYKCVTDGAPRDREVLWRWYQLGAVSPIMMDQDACFSPLGSQTKWTLWSDQATQDVYRAAATLHTRLAPYFRVLAREAAASGMPLMRHPVLLHPGLPEAWAVEDSFYLGPGLYAAPVVRRGVTSRRVWLPPGSFVEWTELTLHQGPATVEVPAPLERLPLFLVADQLLPMLDDQVQTLAPSTEAGVVTEASRAEVLDVRVALSSSGSATLTLADGAGLSAQRTDAPDEGLAAVMADALGSCERCVLDGVVPAGRRVRLNSALASQSTVTFAGAQLRYSGPLRRVRWDVVLLP